MKLPQELTWESFSTETDPNIEFWYNSEHKLLADKTYIRRVVNHLSYIELVKKHFPLFYDLLNVNVKIEGIGNFNDLLNSNNID